MRSSVYFISTHLAPEQFEFESPVLEFTGMRRNEELNRKWFSRCWSLDSHLMSD